MASGTRGHYCVKAPHAGENMPDRTLQPCLARRRFLSGRWISWPDLHWRPCCVCLKPVAFTRQECDAFFHLAAYDFHLFRQVCHPSLLANHPLTASGCVPCLSTLPSLFPAGKVSRGHVALQRNVQELTSEGRNNKGLRGGKSGFHNIWT